MPDQGQIDIIATNSLLSSDDEACGNCPESPESYRSKQDVFDMTLWKLHYMNRPARRDTSLRKSVLVFNLLRCLQRESVPYEVEMLTESSSYTMNQGSDGNKESGLNEDDDMMDEAFTDESDTSGSSDSDTETKPATVTISMMDQEKTSHSQSANGVTFQFSTVSESSWSSVSCGTAESDAMDVDQRSELSLVSLTNCVSEVSHRVSNDGLITESYRLLESGSCILGDQNYQFGRVKTYPSAVTSASGEYRPFDSTAGFNLFA